MSAMSIPHLDVDPFSLEFFDDPYPTHELLRETGPVVYLDQWKVFAVARYAEVHAVLNDPLTFCSSRGVGLSDFAKEKPWRPASLILEADPPAHTRTRSVLNQVLSATVMKPLRERFAAAAAAKVDELLARKSFDAVADLAVASAPRSFAWRGFPTSWRGCAGILRWRATLSRKRSGSRARCRRSSEPRRARSRYQDIASAEARRR